MSTGGLSSQEGKEASQDDKSCQGETTSRGDERGDFPDYPQRFKVTVTNAGSTATTSAAAAAFP